jgi:hypothetical protein
MNGWNRTVQTAAIAAVFPVVAAAVVALAPTRRPHAAEARPEATAVATTAPRAAETYVFVAGSGSGARVTRARTPDGGEVLHGETELSLGALARRRVVEDVTLDARGWLVSAEVRVTGGPDAAEQRLSLDPEHGLVRQASAAGARAWTAPADAPWVYAAPGVGDQEIATPVAAWVLLRAAAAAPAVRQIERGRERAWLVPRGQVAVETEAGTTVVLGGDGADSDGVFVEQVRCAAYALTFVRVPGREMMAM